MNKNMEIQSLLTANNAMKICLIIQVLSAGSFLGDKLSVITFVIASFVMMMLLISTEDRKSSREWNGGRYIDMSNSVAGGDFVGGDLVKNSSKKCEYCGS